MSLTSPNNNRASKSQKMVWFIATTIMVICALVLWGVSSVAAYNKKLQEQKIENEEVVEDTGEVGQVSLTQSIESLNEFEDDVAPIDYETVIRDVNNYPKEFKDSKYLTRYKGKWTLQVMTVNEHSIIKDYLDTRDDREKFAYFRYLDEAGNKKYVLTYDVMADAQEAAGAIGQVDFELPSSISVLPIEIKRYIKRIDNYERAEAVVNLSEEGQREIKLVPTRRQVPAARVTVPKVNDSFANSSNAKNMSSNLEQDNKVEANDTSLDNPQNNNGEDKTESTPFNPQENNQNTNKNAEGIKQNNINKPSSDDALKDKIEQINEQSAKSTVEVKKTVTTEASVKPEVAPNKEEPAPKPFVPDAVNLQ